MTTNLLRGKFSIPAVSLVLAMLLLLPAMALAQVSFVQAADNCMPTSTPACTGLPSSSNSAAVVFDSTTPQTAGNLNVVIVGWSNNTSSVTSVTDTAGNTYQIAVGTNSSTAGTKNVSQEIFFAKNIKVGTGGANTITVTFNQNVPFPDVRVLELSGADVTSPMDVANGGHGNGVSPANSGSATTNFANEMMAAGGTTSFAFSGSPNFTKQLTTVGGNIAGDLAVAVPGSTSATSPVSGNWAMQMATFSPTTTSFATPTLPVAPISPASGEDIGGTAVKITGTNFVQGSVVMFGVGSGSTFTGISAVNCTFASSTELDCTTPPHNQGPVDVGVINPDGQLAFVSAAYKYTQVIPQISSVVPASGPTNGGTQIAINGSNFLAPVSVSADGQPATNVTLTGSTITANVPADIATGATLLVKNADGGSSSTIYTYSNPGTGINFIQMANSGTAPSSASAKTVVMPLAQTVGDLNVVVVGWSDSNPHTIAVTDSEGNTYTAALNATIGTNVGQVIWYAKNIHGGGPSNTITVTYTPAASFPDVRAAEYSGLDTNNPIDTAATGFGSGTMASTSSLTTKFGSEIVVAGGTTDQSFTAGTGFNFVPVDVDTKNGNSLMHKVGTGTIAAAAPLAPSGNWVIQAVAFHAPGNVVPPSFTLAASPTSNSVAPGSSASYTISVSGQSGFNAAVALSCAGPSGVGISCSISPSSVTPGSAPATAMLTVKTTAPTVALLAPHKGKNQLPLYVIWLPLPGMVLAGLGLSTRRRKLLAVMVVLLVIALTLFLAGCGGGGSSSGGGGGGGGTGGTAAGTYNITVTGASSGVSNQSTTVTLTVQ